MHTRGEGDLFGLPGGDETLIEGADDGIVARGGERTHVEHGADRRAAAPDAAMAAPRAAVAGEGGDADQGGDLFMTEAAELG